jgi:hypothetical protein
MISFLTTPRALKTVLAGVFLAGSVAAQAQTPPPGSLADLGAIAGFGTPTPHATTLETFTFVASDTFTTVSFAFREAPAYFAFSSPFVGISGGTNQIVDPQFIGSVDTQLTPTNWGRWIQPIDTSAIGEVSSATSIYGCSGIVPTGVAHFWCDGSVQGYDAIFQSIATTIGQTYTISFGLADNSGPWSNPSIDMLVYALNGLNTVPTGTTFDCPTCSAAPAPPGAPGTVPEPSALALLGLGAVAVMAQRRRARKQA